MGRGDERGGSGARLDAVHRLPAPVQLAERTIENAFFPLAKFQDMAITAWSPLLFGALTGKYTVAKDGSVEGEGRLGGPMGGRMLTPHNLKVAQGLQKVADRLGAAPATVALAWLLHRPAPVIPIVGARNLKQMDQNLACVDLELDADTLAELDALSPPAPTSRNRCWRCRRCEPWCTARRWWTASSPGTQTDRV